MKALTDDTKRQIWALRDGTLRTHRRIAQMVGVSKSAVGEVLRGPRPAPVAGSKMAAPPRPPTREELMARWEACSADDPAANNACRLAVARHDDPDLDKALAEGETLISALLECGDRVLLITTPADFAELARYVTEEDEGQRDPNATDEEHAAYLDGIPIRNRQRVIDLLERALEIVRAT